MGFLLFAFALLAVAAGAIAFFVKDKRAFVQTREGRGVLSGVLLAVAIPLVLALVAEKARALEFLAAGEVFVGLESTRKASPMCGVGANSDKLTSSLGLRASLVRSADGRADVLASYTHHSCAFNPDASSYDALGVQVVYKIF